MLPTRCSELPALLTLSAPKIGRFCSPCRPKLLCCWLAGVVVVVFVRAAELDELPVLRAGVLAFWLLLLPARLRVLCAACLFTGWETVCCTALPL